MVSSHAKYTESASCRREGGTADRAGSTRCVGKAGRAFQPRHVEWEDDDPAEEPLWIEDDFVFSECTEVTSVEF